MAGANLSQTKILPHDEESERVLIASALFSSEALAVFRDLSVDDFYIPDHRIIAAAIFALDNDVGGLRFACGYTRFGPSSRMSFSVKEGEVRIQLAPVALVGGAL